MTAPTTHLDHLVEKAGRWTAARTTRRSFLHRLGQFIVVIAAGPTIATLLMKQVEARVCGQSGVTPKCATFGCSGEGHVWGWCWYASDGCCRNNGLKKICDCCVVNYPNVHGYCPSGTNVACIVESCGEDPRVNQVDIATVAWQNTDGYFSSAVEAGQGARASRAVIALATDRYFPLMAAPLAGALGAPLFVVGAGGLSFSDLSRMQNLGVRTAMLVGAVPSSVNTSLSGAGIQTEAVTTSADRSTAGIEIAERIRSISAIHRTVTVVDSGFSAGSAVFAANFAAVNGFPLVVGAAAADAVGSPTFYVGPEATGASVDAQRTASTNLPALSIELADLAAVSPTAQARRIALVSEASADLVGLLNLQASIVLHPIDRLGTVADWLESHGRKYGKFEKVFFVQGPGQLTPDEYWRLQGTVNGFRVNELMGVSGQGLPVIRQPLAERPIGMARIDGSIPWGSEPAPSYWTSVAQTFRD